MSEIGIEETRLRAHRLRVGLAAGLRGGELVAFTQAKQLCDADVTKALEQEMFPAKGQP